jgi:hypothetical protein
VTPRQVVAALLVENLALAALATALGMAVARPSPTSDRPLGPVREAIAVGPRPL